MWSTRVAAFMLALTVSAPVRADVVINEIFYHAPNKPWVNEGSPGLPPAGLPAGHISSLTVDPVDDSTFWFTTQYMTTDGTFNWRTAIVPMKFSTCP